MGSFLVNPMYFPLLIILRFLIYPSQYICKAKVPMKVQVFDVLERRRFCSILGAFFVRAACDSGFFVLHCKWL